MSILSRSVALLIISVTAVITAYWLGATRANSQYQIDTNSPELTKHAAPSTNRPLATKTDKQLDALLEKIRQQENKIAQQRETIQILNNDLDDSNTQLTKLREELAPEVLQEKIASAIEQRYGNEISDQLKKLSHLQSDNQMGMAKVDEKIENEERNESWAYAIELASEDFLINSPHSEKLTLNDAECKSTVCQFTFSTAPDFTEWEQYKAAWLNQPALENFNYTFIFKSDDQITVKLALD